MKTPDEAIEELEYAVQQLGFKAVLIASFVRRPVASVERSAARSPLQATWVDSFGLDSLYDYDPFWARCLELGVSPAAHSGAVGWDGHRSPSNYMFNHLGLLRDARRDALPFALPRRRHESIPEASPRAPRGRRLVGRPPLRTTSSATGRSAIPSRSSTTTPPSFDRELWNELFAARRRAAASSPRDPTSTSSPSASHDRARRTVDEFAACGLATDDDIPSASSRTSSSAARPTIRCPPRLRHALAPGGEPLRAIFGSDVGHWDVPDMRDVLHEAYELVEEGRLDAKQFRDFTFENAARFYTDTNPGFFEGTAIAEPARSWVAAQPAARETAASDAARRT